MLKHVNLIAVLVLFDCKHAGVLSVIIINYTCLLTYLLTYLLTLLILP